MPEPKINKDWFANCEVRAKYEKPGTKAAPLKDAANKDKNGVSIGDELFKNVLAKEIASLRLFLPDAARVSSSNETSNMTEILLGKAAMDRMSQPQLIPGAYGVIRDQDSGREDSDDLAVTPTPQRPVIPKSLTIPDTVDENACLTTKSNLDEEKPSAANEDEEKLRKTFGALKQTKVSPNLESILRSSRSFMRSSSSAPSTSDDDLFQIGSPRRLAPGPLQRIKSSSSPPVNALAVRRGSGGILAHTLISRSSAGKSLRPSSSASHLPLLQNAASSKHTSAKIHGQRHSHYAIFNQLSDSESIGSGDSNQDLTNGANWAKSILKFHRQTSGGSIPFFSRGSNSVLDASPSRVRNGQANSIASRSRSQLSTVGRSISNDLLDDDILSQISGIATDGSPTGNHHAAKHLRTEKLVSKHTLKGRSTKFQRLLDKAFALINMSTEESIMEGCELVAKIMINAWGTSKIGHDLAYGLCDYLRQMTYFDLLLSWFLHRETKRCVRLAIGRALEECLSASNREYISSNGDTLTRLVDTLKSFNLEEEIRVAVSLLESLFKHSACTNVRMIDASALDYVLTACKTATNVQTLKHAALALANLSIYSDNQCQQRMIAKNVSHWLFFLASSQDVATRYYACLGACVLVSNKEIESAVIRSGVMELVEQFLLAHKPTDFANSDSKNIQGKPKLWLEKLVPALNAKRREPRAMAAFHFAMEASIKRDQDRVELFHEIGAVEALKQVAALPEDVAPKFASLALEIIGAEVPHKLSPQVPLWSIEDVQYWVTHIGFEKYAYAFGEQRVDGDLLLLLGEEELEKDIGMASGLLRRRFVRELESLKMAADYSCLDDTQIDRFLVSIDPHFSLYTYRLLEMGIDRSILPSLTDDLLRNACGIENPVHRLKLLKSIEECKHIDDMEVALLSKHIDIFISYRRSTGNQLASLIKVLLQLRGYKVFIDVDRLYAGKFDCSLLKNIQAAKHFILVLTPRALDRCIDDEECSDWLHKELLCALDCNKNIIPVFDPHFDWPDESRLPNDIRAITRFNGVRWVHEYQEACVDKLAKFIEDELNRDGGYLPSRLSGSHYNQRSGSKTQNDASDTVLESLQLASRTRLSSTDYLSNGLYVDRTNSIDSALQPL